MATINLAKNQRGHAWVKETTKKIDVALKDVGVNYTAVAADAGLSPSSVARQFRNRNLTSDLMGICLLILAEKGNPITLEWRE